MRTEGPAHGGFAVERDIQTASLVGADRHPIADGEDRVLG
jgi:hypothetical protein